MSKQTNQTNKKKKRKFMAIFFPILGAAAVATGVTLGCLYGCKKNDTSDWRKYFNDPGEAERHQKASDVGVAVEYEFNLKEAVPTGEKVYGDVEIVKYSHDGVHATVTDFELNEGEKKATFTAAIDEVPQTSANGTTTYWADIKAEVKCKKILGDEVVWETTIEDIRIQVEVEPTPPGPAPTDYNYMTITTDKDTTVNFKLANKGVSVQDRKPDVDYWDGDSFETINWGTAETISGEQVFSYEIDLVAGQTLYLKGDNPTGFNYLSEDGETKSTVSIVSPEDSDDSKWTLGGSPMALVNDGSKQEEDSLTVVGTGCFAYLFMSEIGDSTKTYYKNANIASIGNPDTFLPATTLTTYCYIGMFSSCASLTNIPDIPATTIPLGACANMFQECNSLISIDEDWGDSVETVELAGFQSMFSDCLNLETPMDELPALDIGAACYEQMFIGCENLQSCPKLPATTLDGYCYDEMFQRCFSLTEVPELNATVLPTGCYDHMFYSCYNITTIPNITITAANSSTCWSMFAIGNDDCPEAPEKWIELEAVSTQTEANLDISQATEAPYTAFTEMFAGPTWRGGVNNPTTTPGFYKFVVKTKS